MHQWNWETNVTEVRGTFQEILGDTCKGQLRKLSKDLTCVKKNTKCSRELKRFWDQTLGDKCSRKLGDETENKCTRKLRNPPNNPVPPENRGRQRTAGEILKDLFKEWETNAENNGGNPPTNLFGGESHLLQRTLEGKHASLPQDLYYGWKPKPTLLGKNRWMPWRCGTSGPLTSTSFSALVLTSSMAHGNLIHGTGLLQSFSRCLWRASNWAWRSRLTQARWWALGQRSPRIRIKHRIQWSPAVAGTHHAATLHQLVACCFRSTKPKEIGKPSGHMTTHLFVSSYTLPYKFVQYKRLNMLERWWPRAPRWGLAISAQRSNLRAHRSENALGTWPRPEWRYHLPCMILVEPGPLRF